MRLKTRFNLDNLKGSARKLGFQVRKVTLDQGSVIRITKIGNATILAECGTLKGAYGWLDRESDKRRKAEITRRANLDSALVNVS